MDQRFSFLNKMNRESIVQEELHTVSVPSACFVTLTCFASQKWRAGQAARGASARGSDSPGRSRAGREDGGVST